MFPELVEWVNAMTEWASAVTQQDHALAAQRMPYVSQARDKLTRLYGGPVFDSMPGTPSP